MIAIAVLIIHCFYNCYQAFTYWNLTNKITDQLLHNISHTGLFKSFLKSKLIALGFLLLSLLGIKGRKSEKLNYRTAFAYLIAGLIFYFASGITLLVPALIWK